MYFPFYIFSLHRVSTRDSDQTMITYPGLLPISSLRFVLASFMPRRLQPFFARRLKSLKRYLLKKNPVKKYRVLASSTSLCPFSSRVRVAPKFSRAFCACEFASNGLPCTRCVTPENSGGCTFPSLQNTTLCAVHRTKVTRAHV